MTQIKESLHSGVCLAFKTDNGVFQYGGSGIKPLLEAVTEHKTALKGASAADKIVGKAAALVFAYAGVAYVYAEILSGAAQVVFEKHGIVYDCGVLTEKIMNRANTDICPMERLCAEIDSPQKAFEALCVKVGIN